MSEESSSSKTFAEKQAERMKRLKELHLKRVSKKVMLTSKIEKIFADNLVVFVYFDYLFNFFSLYL